MGGGSISVHASCVLLPHLEHCTLIRSFCKPVPQQKIELQRFAQGTLARAISHYLYAAFWPLYDNMSHSSLLLFPLSSVYFSLANNRLVSGQDAQLWLSTDITFLLLAFNEWAIRSIGLHWKHPAIHVRCFPVSVKWNCYEYTLNHSFPPQSSLCLFIIHTQGNGWHIN